MAIHLKTNSRDTQLTPAQARKIGTQLLLAANNAPQQSTRSAPVTQRSTATTRRKTASSRLAGELTFVGKSSFQDERMKGVAKDLAKSRAEGKFNSWKRSMEGQGKSVSGTKSGKFVIDKGEVAYVISVTLE